MSEEFEADDPVDEEQQNVDESGEVQFVPMPMPVIKLRVLSESTIDKIQRGLVRREYESPDVIF